MMLVRPMTPGERDLLAARAKRAAMRHMLADGVAFNDVRRALGLSIRVMPRDVILPRGQAKRVLR